MSPQAYVFIVSSTIVILVAIAGYRHGAYLEAKEALNNAREDLRKANIELDYYRRWQRDLVDAITQTAMSDEVDALLNRTS